MGDFGTSTRPFWVFCRPGGDHQAAERRDRHPGTPHRQRDCGGAAALVATVPGGPDHRPSPGLALLTLVSSVASRW